MFPASTLNIFAEATQFIAITSVLLPQENKIVTAIGVSYPHFYE